MKCPCCKGKLIYKKLETDTHAWICDTCPIVMLEMYDSSNIEALKKLLQGGDLDDCIQNNKINI